MSDPSQAAVVVIAPDLAAVTVQWQNAPKLVAKSIVTIFQTIGAGLVSYIGTQLLSGQVLGVRSGNLRRSLYFRVFADPDGLSAGVYVGADIKKAPQAAVQEFGGTISAKSAGALTIPLAPDLTNNGVMRVSAREFFDNPSSLGFDHAFINPKGTAIMGVSKGQAPVPVFALKTSVTLPERSYLRAGVNERRDWILAQLGASVQSDIASNLGASS